MNVYDVLSYDRSMVRHKMLSRKKVQEREQASTRKASKRPPSTTTRRWSTQRGSP